MRPKAILGYEQLFELRNHCKYCFGVTWANAFNIKWAWIFASFLAVIFSNTCHATLQMSVSHESEFCSFSLFTYRISWRKKIIIISDSLDHSLAFVVINSWNNFFSLSYRSFSVKVLSPGRDFNSIIINFFRNQIFFFFKKKSFLNITLKNGILN